MCDLCRTIVGATHKHVWSGTERGTMGGVPKSSLIAGWPRNIINALGEKKRPYVAVCRVDFKESLPHKIACGYMIVGRLPVRSLANSVHQLLATNLIIPQQIQPIEQLIQSTVHNPRRMHLHLSFR